MTMFRVTLAVAFSFSLAAQLSAQPATRPGAPLLGQRFESLAAGIAFRPPADMKQLRGAIGSTEVVRFVNEDRKWILKVSRVLLEPDKPLPLSVWKDKDGIERPGMLEFITSQFKTETPGAEVLRQDVIEIGEASVGLMAAKFNFGLETNLSQQAIVRASDLQYYVFALTCAVPRQGNIEADPTTRLAVESFNAMVDTVQLLDQSRLKQDQDERLYRTRSLFVNLTRDKLSSTLVKEQWLRVVRDGKDVGYTYVIEEIARDLPRKGRPERQAGTEGVLVGARARLIPETGGQTDSESWLFCTFDRKYEAWSSIAVTDDPNTGRISSGELGVSRWREKPIPAPGAGLGTNPGVSLTEEYRLEVTKLGQNVSSEPTIRDLPPFYLPHALGQLVPRLVPLREPKGYLFATWVSDTGQVVYRYVDVGSEREVMLAGKRVRAVPVNDRVGLEGSITTHYISPDQGRYLGSVNEDSKITILPTDAPTLEKLWKQADLTRPKAVEGKTE